MNFKSAFSGPRFRPALIAGAICLAFTAATMSPDARARDRHHKKPKAEAKTTKKVKRKPRSSPAVLSAPTGFAMDAESGTVLFDDNGDKRKEPASLTKLMTGIIVFDAMHQEKLTAYHQFPLASAASDEEDGAVSLNKKGIPPGTKLTVDKLLLATAVTSAADATITLANAVCGNVSCFVDLMNKKTREILQQKPGEQTTHFANPHGMPDARQYSTARDMAKIVQYMTKHYPQEYNKYFGQTSYTINGKHMNGHILLLVNYKCKNAVGLDYRCMDGAKSGFFRAAGVCLAGSAFNDGYRVIAVRLGDHGGGSRDANMSRYFTEGFKKLKDTKAPRTAKGPLVRPDIIRGTPELEQEPPDYVPEVLTPPVTPPVTPTPVVPSL